MKALSLGKTCAACGTDRTVRSLKYDLQTMKAYCDNPYICNDNHPNAPKNIVERRSEVALYGYDTASEAYKHRLLEDFNEVDMELIRRLLTKPATFRVLDADTAKFIVKLKNEKGLDGVSGVVRYALERLMESHDMVATDHKAAQETVKKIQAVEQVIAQPEAAPVETPKPTGEGWDF